MPSLNEFIQRARDRKDDFIQSFYPLMEMHLHNSGNNKHVETLETLGLYNGRDVLNLIDSQAKLAQTQLDVYGYNVSNYTWVKYNVSSNLSVTGNILRIAEHKCVFAGLEYTVKASEFNLQQLASNWNSVIWNLSLKLYIGRGYARIEPSVNYVPETTHLVHIGTWKQNEDFDVEGHVRMFNFKMNV